MAFDDDDLGVQARLKRTLRLVGKPISYGALARALNVTGPGAIGRITAALELTMHEDMAAHRPFLAAMCEGKLSGGIPALGFFEMARALGRYDGPLSGPEAVAFALSERSQLLRDNVA